MKRRYEIEPFTNLIVDTVDKRVFDLVDFSNIVLIRNLLNEYNERQNSIKDAEFSDVETEKSD